MLEVMMKGITEITTDIIMSMIEIMMIMTITSIMTMMMTIDSFD